MRGRKPRECTCRTEACPAPTRSCPLCWRGRYHRPMRKLLTWLLVTIGIAALIRRLRRRGTEPEPLEQPAAEDAADGEELLAAVRALATQVGGLQAELQALRAQVRPLPVDGADRPGWDEGTPAPRDSAAWVRSLES